MAVSPTFEQLEYVYDDTSVRIVNGSLGFWPPEECYLSYWMHILSLILVLVGLVGNSMVLWLLNFRTWRNAFFLCCYFLILIEELVTSVYDSSTYTVLLYLSNTIYTVGLSLLAVTSTQSCLAVLFPSWYLHDCHRNISAAVCSVLWVLPGLFRGADIVLCFSLGSHVFCGAFYRVPAVWLVHFTPVMCGSSLTLLLRVQCSFQCRQPPRLYFLVLLMVLVSVLCGLPRGIQESILRFPLRRLYCLHSLAFPYMPYWLFRLLACLKSSAYPFIYFLLGRQRDGRGREPLRVVLQRALADDQELEGERRDSHLTNIQEICASSF